MTDLATSRVDRFLAGVASRPQQRGNLIFALDATASREQTWDTACQLQAQMFREVANIGTLEHAAGLLSRAPRFRRRVQGLSLGR